MDRIQRLLGLLVGILALSTSAIAAPSAKHSAKATKQTLLPEKVILDTDIGTDIDDAYALALLVSLPNMRVLGVTTAYGETQKRAELAAKILRVAGHPGVPVFAGRSGKAEIGGQYAWVHGTQKISKMDAVSFLHRELARAPGQITLIAIGPLTNLGDLLTRYPDDSKKIKRLVIMGGAVYVGYNNQPPPVPEYNIQMDPKAAQVVFASGVPLTMAGLEVTTMLRLEKKYQRQLFALGTPTTDALSALTVLWGDGVPVLYDAMAVAWAAGGHFCEAEQKRVVVEANGLTRIVEGSPNVTVLIKPQKEAFLDWVISALQIKTP